MLLFQILGLTFAFIIYMVIGGVIIKYLDIEHILEIDVLDDSFTTFMMILFFPFVLIYIAVREISNYIFYKYFN